jgi:hypothetical protein
MNSAKSMVPYRHVCHKRYVQDPSFGPLFGY